MTKPFCIETIRPAFIPIIIFYESDSSDPKTIPLGIGAKVWIEMEEGRTEFMEFYPYRGYLSSMEPALHIGLGNTDMLKQIRVRWPDGKENLLKGISADQTLLIRYETAQKGHLGVAETKQPLLSEVGDQLGLRFQHQEQNNFMDFRVQALLPHMHSREGPGMAVGDVNQDGWEDVFVGNGKGATASFFLQQTNGSFSRNPQPQTNESDDMGALLLDVDADNDLDLYLAKGGTELRAYDSAFQDQLLLNDGRGNFVLSPDALPASTISSSTINAADIDRDGDLDLFVGGRLIPQSYPLPESSRILINEEGSFSDQTTQLCPELEQIGMVSAALWTDFNQDGWVDLMVTGEWMSIHFFENREGKLLPVSPSYESLVGPHGLNTSGWWNSIASGDFDKDGDVDYVLGNQGLNNQYEATQSYPLLMYAKDFDENGSMDHLIGSWREGEYYPIHLRNDFLSQLNKKKQNFLKFETYANTSFFKLMTEEELEGAYEAKVSMFESIWLENLGENRFIMRILPTQSQYAPTYGILVEDVNQDGQLDLLLVGNKYGTETFSGRHDASIGSLLLGDGQDGFTAASSRQSGFVVAGDAKSLASLVDAHGQLLILAAQNNDSLLAFAPTQQAASLNLELDDLDFSVRLNYKNGKTEIREFYYGSGYLSQHSRKLRINPAEVEEVWMKQFDGKERKMYPK